MQLSPKSQISARPVNGGNGFHDLSPRVAASVAPIPPRRGRRVIRPFYPSLRDGPFQVPPMLAERASAVLGSAGNADESFRLLVWLLASNQLGLPFPVDRRAVARSGMIGLTVDQIRGALDALVKRGLLERLVPKGQGGFQKDASGKLKLNEDGKPIKKVILFRFSATVAECFVKQVPARRRRESSKSPKAGPLVLKNRFRGFENPHSDQAPMAEPKRFPKCEGTSCSVPDSEAEAFLETLRQKPLPLLTDTARNAGRRTFYGRKP